MTFHFLEPQTTDGSEKVTEKRIPNAFIDYRNEMMQYNKDNLPMTEFSKLVSQNWRDMPEDKKAERMRNYQIRRDQRSSNTVNEHAIAVQKSESSCSIPSVAIQMGERSDSNTSMSVYRFNQYQPCSNLMNYQHSVDEQMCENSDFNTLIAAVDQINQCHFFPNATNEENVVSRHMGENFDFNSSMAEVGQFNLYQTFPYVMNNENDVYDLMSENLDNLSMYQPFSNIMIDEYILSGQMSESLELNSSMEFNQYQEYQGEYLDYDSTMASYYQFNQYQTFPNARNDEHYVVGQTGESLDLSPSIEFNQYQGEYLDYDPSIASSYDQFNQYQTSDSIPLITDMGTIYNCPSVC
ncbi:20142_t:CDS:1 [Funneliformis geosporum]|uniref:15803_t:CDS:1 n=1 Tax=Funneliformis geosporum TaxID=1117311 RepID=A0A9W4SUE6_9GLOM|nr:20142_t:CDS:1 [Funneliformis geosporum]CAI2181818.1 15803_t:CDS:1 [Funneliformis geosporum]